MKPSTLLEHSTCLSTSRTLVRILPLLAARRHADHHRVPFSLWSPTTIARATIDVLGNITHLLPPEIHGDPEEPLRCCDAFVSLHRSEAIWPLRGRGNGAGKASNRNWVVRQPGLHECRNGVLVDFRLITVKKDEYTGRFGRNLIGGPMIQSPRWAAELGQKASRHCSYRARGMAMPPRSCRVARPR